TPLADELASHRFFRDLPEHLVNQLAAWAAPVEFTAEEKLITTGKPADRMLALQSGRVAVGVHVPQLGLSIIETLNSGDVLGWSWLLPPYRWTFDAIGIKAGRAIQIEAAPVRELLTGNPVEALPLVMAMAGVMNERLHSARARLLNLYGGDE
ncbi:MAG: cyclic nucleotide-binding domain-containing protein, partial [Candidatus Nanopelagicales bacterium]|nr:cyclic nucleotide-binding domain-containing protein [Candidatus Nanopelagicales bacterium]